MPDAIRPVLSHMAIYVHDMAKMEDFYTRVMGLVVTDRGKAFKFPIDLVFMSSQPGMHHQFALASGRSPEATYSVVNQMSFRVRSLDELRVMASRVKAEGVADLAKINHGNAWSLYFLDPEGNCVEVYLDSPWHVPQPHGDDLDLEQTNETIMRTTLEAVRTEPGFMPREEYEAEMRRKFDS
ncbi:MAG: VOC family protein [SAR202 cluster bacterium]|jgi:catechol 2,3-dioxygenase|nr:glyoxalase [Acidobacteriota bacterium]MDP6800046.1 VOC family protein [SAR202 cluster bacterium]MQG58439.1 VOC family protein [SAR202 cluster bacterium]MQG69273.1 VOC family protein [SAR202 cluster bacterium]HAK55052.1 glyoxalase [Acidobacteriota bacterium]|tara:strand:- start:173 stop:718 length:546 start_codon:yes stop_codon:yes gene_type:complete